jgi:hypothetical protein
LLFTCLASVCEAVDGTAQMTGGNLAGGTCMFSNYTLPPGIYGSTMSGPDWDAGGMCGGCLFVRGERGAVVAMVHSATSLFIPCPLSFLEMAQ